MLEVGRGNKEPKMFFSLKFDSHILSQKGLRPKDVCENFHVCYILGAESLRFPGCPNALTDDAPRLFPAFVFCISRCASIS